MAPKKLVNPAAQPSKIVMNDLFPPNIESQIDNTEKEEHLPLLQCRSFVSHFAKKVRNWQLDDDRWALLRRTPFGKIIEGILELVDVSVDVVDALLGFWDKEHCGFLIGGRIIPFTVDDIALITGIPNRGLKVVRRRARSKLQGRLHPVNRVFWAITMIEHRLDQILRNKDTEADKYFVQLMILYLWGCVMFPSSNGVVPQYMVCYVEDLDAMGTYNWAEALHSVLVKEINAKFKILKDQIDGKKTVPAYFYGVYSIIHVWFFEHVNFGEDSRPSNPKARPRMLKWEKECKCWRKKPFLRRLKEVVKDEVCLFLLPRDDELELVSQPCVERMHSKVEGSLDVGTDMRVCCEEEGMSDGQMEEEKKDAQEEAEASAEATRLKKVVHIVVKQSAQISALEKRVVNLEKLATSKVWDLEDDGGVDEADDDDMGGGKLDEQAIDRLIETIYESCVKEKGEDHTKEDGVCILNVQSDEISRRHQKNRKGKKPVSKEHLMLKRKGSLSNGKESTVKRLVRIEKKDSNMLVNLDDYATPIDHKKAKAEPLSYVGRELLTEDERIYLDAFCGKPMQRDDIVFFNWNIIIRRQSMVEYLQGGCTGEEIIDAYARILHERADMPGNDFASFLYVPPLFLGLYRSKLGSYRTFLNAINKTTLEKVKFLFLPCHISSSGHWLLLVCDMDAKKWKVFNSLYDPRHREVAKEQMMILTEYLYLDHRFDIRTWSLEYRRVYPQQEPGTLDCGIFVMKFMENIISIPREIDFRAADMRLFRPRIAYQILCHG